MEMGEKEEGGRRGGAPWTETGECARVEVASGGELGLLREQQSRGPSAVALKKRHDVGTTKLRSIHRGFFFHMSFASEALHFEERVGTSDAAENVRGEGDGK